MKPTVTDSERDPVSPQCLVTFPKLTLPDDSHVFFLHTKPPSSSLLPTLTMCFLFHSANKQRVQGAPPNMQGCPPHRLCLSSSCRLHLVSSLSFCFNKGQVLLSACTAPILELSLFFSSSHSLFLTQNPLQVRLVLSVEDPPSAHPAPPVMSLGSHPPSSPPG